MNGGTVNEGFEDERVIRQRISHQTENNPIELENVQINVPKINLEESETTENTESYFEKLNILLEKHRKNINLGITVIFNGLLLAYFSYATYFYIQSDQICGMKWCTGYGFLLLLFVIVYFLVIYYRFLKPKLGNTTYNSVYKPVSKVLKPLSSKLAAKLGVLLVIAAAFAVYLFFDTDGSRYRLRSLAAITIIFSIGFIFSKSPKHINWRTVTFGFVFQFLLGIFCIRWEVGRSIFSCFGDKVETFLNYTISGASFVFSDDLMNVFAFSVLPVIFFFSFCISILYYLGAMQWFLRKLGWILQIILGTTVCESVTAAANIFLGMSESPLLIRPYIKLLTHSEIHSVMTSGFATVSGTVLAAFIKFGADPAHLITASVMAAPAALCYAKLFYPETEKSKTKSDNIQMEKSTDSSVLDAASNGATIAIPIVLGIIANLVAFVSFIAFINGVLGWGGELVGVEDLDLKFLFRHIFRPVAYILGVDWEHSEYVAELIATKVIINEFVAYERLGYFQDQGLLWGRNSAIATYAICGFANPSSLGIMIGSLGALAPERRPAITKVALRAFISGTFVCLLTSSIAGLLLSNDMFDDQVFNTTTVSPVINSTVSLY